MEVQRNFFIFSFLFVSFLLWQEWQSQSLSLARLKKTSDSTFHAIDKESKNYIFVKNDVISLSINMYGGDIEDATLLKYRNKLNSDEPLKILATESDFVYHAQSGITGKDGPDNSKYQKRPLYYASQKTFELKPKDKELHVPIIFIDKNGVVYKKNFILKPGKYDIEVEYRVNNKSNKKIEFNIFGQLKQTITLPKKRNIYSNNFALQTFRGAAYSSTNEKYEKYKFNTIADNKHLNTVTKEGWIAMLQQYFAVAWIPKNHGLNTLYTSYLNHDIAAIGYKSPIIYLPPHQKSCITSKLWIGPEIQKEMALVAPNLDLTVDYGWLWFLSQPLFKLLSILHDIIGNWGFAIVLITFIIKACMHPLTKSQYISMIKMRSLQPEINLIKKNFSHDKQRLSKEIMHLYKKEKLNPFSGFLPILIQMPIFLALYYMLIGSVELRHAPFILWIHDLSGQDPYYILPITMGLTMFFVQKTSISSNNPSDPLQQKIIRFMPVLFTVFFLWFPSGLVLYYIVSNLVTIVQHKCLLSKLSK